MPHSSDAGDKNSSASRGSRLRAIKGRLAGEGVTIHPAASHLLIPIDGTPRSHWSVKYALWKRRIGEQIEVSLLHVAEPLLRPWDILRFRTEQEIASWRAERAQYLLEDAATALLGNDIIAHLHFREGDLVFEILDTAEQLGCDQIVMPAPARGWQRVFSRRIVPRVLRLRRDVPIVTVNPRGFPESG